MEIFEIASMLGKKLKEDERLVRRDAARAAYEANKELQDALNEYEADQIAYQQEASKENPDTFLCDTLQERLDALYKKIVENEDFVAYRNANDEVNALMNEVNNTIVYEITGEMPCTHDCSTCHGGCSH